jgi:nitrate/nitrite transporter NarK
LGVIVFVLAFAVVEGVSSANWIMLGDYFGRSRFASLMGFMSMFHNVGLFISPIYAGRVRDNTGNYDEVFVTFIPLYIISAVLFLLATRPSPPVLDRVGPKTTAVAG